LTQNQRPTVPRPDHTAGAGRTAPRAGIARPANQTRPAQVRPGQNGARPAQPMARRPVPQAEAQQDRREMDLTAILQKLVPIFTAVAVILFSAVLWKMWPNGWPLVLRDDSQAPRVAQIYTTGAIRLNEVMSSNSKVLIDRSGNSPDWVEVINTSDHSVNIGGWSLAPTENSASVFTFPDYTLQAGQCVVVYCDNKLRNTAGEDFHAPFALSSRGDTLMLFNAGGAAVDTVQIPALQRNQSYVRTGTAVWETTFSATPAMANTEDAYATFTSVRTSDVIQISEFMASNTMYMPDASLMHYDYIELHNTSAQPVSLGGYFLSDSADDPRRCVLPDVMIPANGYVVVFASGKEGVQPDGTLHVSFSLGTEKETVILCNPMGQVVQAVPYDMLADNQAATLTADGSWVVGQTPTPGAANP